MRTITFNVEVKLTIRPPINLPDIILPPQELRNPPLNMNLNERISHRRERINIPSVSPGNQRPSRNLNRGALIRNVSYNYKDWLSLNLVAIRRPVEPIKREVNIGLVEPSRRDVNRRQIEPSRRDVNIGPVEPIRRDVNIGPVEPSRRDVNIRPVVPSRREVQPASIIPQGTVNLENNQPIMTLENPRPGEPIGSRRPNINQHIGQPSMNQIPQIEPVVVRPLIILNQNNFNNQIDINNNLEDIEITEQILNKSNTKTCVICQEDYNIMEKICYLPCFHFYHSQCIRQWVQTSNICPICKNEINFD